MAMRAGALLLGALIGIVPLLLYNHAAFGSWTHIAYANIKQQQQGFFGISTPAPEGPDHAALRLARDADASHPS